MRESSITRRDFIKVLGTASIYCSGLSNLEFLKPANFEETLSKPNILVLVFDALSALDMSLYGFQRDTTPNFERFAERATVYHRHISGGNFTTPGTASLLTGVMPWEHRAINLQGNTTDRYSIQNIFGFLPNEYHSFAYTQNPLAYILLDQFKKEINDLLNISDLSVFSGLLTDQLPLKEFHAPYEAELLATKINFSTKGSLVISQLDELYRNYRINHILESQKTLFPYGLINCKTGDSNNVVCFDLMKDIDWLSHQLEMRPRPFFGYIHLFPPHAPYNARRDFIGKFEEKLDIPIKPQHHFSEGKNTKALNRSRSRYNETIAYVDSEFGRLLDLMAKNEAFENTCIIVTSDHGEILERGISGHNTPVLYEPLIHIPLIIKYPGQNIRQDIRQPTHAIDIVPTLLSIAGAEPVQDLGGITLPRTPDQNWENRDLYVVEAKSSPKLGRMHKATFSLFRDPIKLIYYHGYANYDEVYEMYNLADDPEEIENLYHPEDATSIELKTALSNHIRDYI